MPVYGQAIIAFSLLIGLATVFLAYFIYDDYEKLEWIYGRSSNINRRFEKLEQVVDRNPENSENPEK
jgi:hypothetical protein